MEHEEKFMKKKLWLAVLGLALSMACTACGSKSDETGGGEQIKKSGESQKEETEKAETKDSESGTYLKDINAADYVTLGTYTGIEIAIDEPEVTDEMVDDYIDYILKNSPVSIPVTDRSVEMGDIVNIDYEGKFDGVAFDGGTAKGTDLTIGSGRFIEGFEDGCIGMKIGETKDVEATFPDPYSNNPAYAGKTAVFTVTLNSIRVEEIPEFTDEFVQSLGLEGCSNVEEYRAYAYDVLKENQETEYASRKTDLAYTAVAEECYFEDAPEGMVQRMNDTLTANISSYASMYGVDIGTYVEAFYGGSAENYEETLLEEANKMAQYYLMLQAIADLENMSVPDEELEEQIASEAADYGYETDEYREMIDAEAFREYLLTQKVLAFITDNAVTVPAQ